MRENLMVGSHKHTTKEWRDNYDRIFGGKKEMGHDWNDNPFKKEPFSIGSAIYAKKKNKKNLEDIGSYMKNLPIREEPKKKRGK